MSEEIRFALTTSLDSVKSFHLDANFTETENWIKKQISPYAQAVVDPDDMKNAKDVLARIRRVRKGINDERISLEKQYMAPFNDFKQRVNDRLITLCAAAEENLAGQIAEYEARLKAEKFAALEQFFTDNVGDMAEFLTFDQIRNDRWGNATFTLENAQAEITQAIAMCEDGVNAIRSLGSPFEAPLLNAYRKNHDVAGAMKLNGELTEQKRREDERKAAIEAAKTIPQRKEVEEVQHIAKPEPKPEPPTVDADKLYTVTLRIQGTQEQLVALRKYLDDAGMRFQSVK